MLGLKNKINFLKQIFSQDKNETIPWNIQEHQTRTFQAFPQKQWGGWKIQKYQQENINAGLLHGMHEDLTPCWNQCLNKAHIFFQGKPYAIIKPQVYQDCNNDLKYLLPDYFTMALLEKDEPLKEEDGDGSSLRVVWWQDHPGEPDPQIMEHIVATSWAPPFAWSWFI